MRTKLKTSKTLEVRENSIDQFTIVFSFTSDWLRESGASFLDQSQSKVKKNQRWKLLYE